MADFGGDEGGEVCLGVAEGGEKAGIVGVGTVGDVLPYATDLEVAPPRTREITENIGIFSCIPRSGSPAGRMPALRQDRHSPPVSLPLWTGGGALATAASPQRPGRALTMAQKSNRRDASATVTWCAASCNSPRGAVCRRASNSPEEEAPPARMQSVKVAPGKT